MVSVNLNEPVSTGGTKYLGSYLYGKEHYLSGNPGYRAGKEHYLSPSSSSSVGYVSGKQEFDTMDAGEKARMEQHIDQGKLDEKVKDIKIENAAKAQILKEETKEERKAREEYNPPPVTNVTVSPPNVTVVPPPIINVR